MFQPIWHSRHMVESSLTSLPVHSVRMGLWLPKYLKSKSGGCEKACFLQFILQMKNYRWEVSPMKSLPIPTLFSHNMLKTLPQSDSLCYFSFYYSMSPPFVPSLKHFYYLKKYSSLPLVTPSYTCSYLHSHCTKHR